MVNENFVLLSKIKHVNAYKSRSSLQVLPKYIIVLEHVQNGRPQRPPRTLTGHVHFYMYNRVINYNQY